MNALASFHIVPRPELQEIRDGATMSGMTTRLCILASILSVAFLGGCGGGSDGAKCFPGLTVACPCPTGQNGSQTCTSSGTFAACVCASPGVDSGGLGGTGGTIAAPLSGGTGGQVIAFLDAGIGGTGGTTVPPTSSGTGGKETTAAGAGTGDTGGVSIPITSVADASMVGAETAGVVAAADTRPAPDVNMADVPAPKAICGDGVVVPPETCDDGNTMPFDGCSTDCRKEPVCNGSGPCTSTCGDGFVINEDCDDGNTIGGDGCSSDCKVEPGWTCSQPPIGKEMIVPAVYRSFHPHNPGDFEPGVSGQTSASTSMVNTVLDSDGKPVYANPTNPGGAVHVASATTFAEWFRDTDGVNHANPSTMALWDNGNGAYVNRYGINGEQWNVTQPAYFCGSVGSELMDASGNPIPCTSKYQVQAADGGLTSVQTDCQKMEAQGYSQLPGSCTTDSSGAYYRAQYTVQRVDGTPLYFPVDGDPFVPASELMAAQIPPPYDPTGTWPWDLDNAGKKRLHVFSFTSEIRYWFKYESSRNYVLPFVADDDVWVFINKKLALDLGGIHTPVAGAVALDSTAASTLGLVDGNVYEVAVFQAQRQSDGSSLQLTLPSFNTAPSECTPM